MNSYPPDNIGVIKERKTNAFFYAADGMVDGKFQMGNG